MSANGFLSIVARLGSIMMPERGKHGAKIKKALGRITESFVFFAGWRKLLSVFLFEKLLVLVVELINATGAIDELHLTRVEGVRSAGDFKFH